ncbi:hypothetical protein ES707_08910 [subsurface metagenome]
MEVKEILRQRGCLNVEGKKESIHKFFVSGYKHDFKFVAEKLLRKEIDKAKQYIQL